MWQNFPWKKQDGQKKLEGNNELKTNLAQN